MSDTPPRPLHSGVLLIALLLIVPCAAALAANAPAPTVASGAKRWFDERSVQRSGREGLRKDEAANRVERAKQAVKVALEVVEKAKAERVPGQDALLQRMRVFIALLDPSQAAALDDSVKSLTPEPASADAKSVTAWNQFIALRRSAFTKPTERLGQKALDFGDYDIAHDCLDQVLTFDPDSPGLRKTLNLTKVGERWYGPKDMVLVKAGLQWDEQLGWVIAKDAERYRKGDYFDLQSKSWTTLDQANALHSTLDKEWVVQTEHLEIRGNAPLKALIDVANRVETFYGKIFASYASFFAKDKSDVKLIFGLLDHERLAMSVAKDQGDYRKSLPTGTDAGWSAGMWIPAAGSSFFFAGPHEVMYHEFTHQILDVFSHGCRAPAWVVEGVAVYTQSPRFEQGVMTLGVLAKNHMVLGYFAERAQGKALTLDQLLAIDNSAAWAAAKDPGPQYSAAGALVEFCMEADDRRYRADFIDFLRESYLGTAQHPLWDYLGMGKDAFASAFEHWLSIAPTTAGR